MVSRPAAPCYLCKEADVETAGRCKPCNALYQRTRCSCKGTPGRWEKFLAATKEDTAEFYTTGHRKLGKELKAAIDETISEHTAEKDLEQWCQDGKYLDEEDLTEKYKKKPEQLKSIKDKTHTFFSLVRNVWLYEDPEFASKSLSSKEITKDTKRQISTERNAKAGKVPKTTPEGGEEVELSTAQVKILEKEAKALDTPETGLQGILDQCEKEEIAPLIAAPLLAKLKLAIAALNGQRTMIDMTLEHKKGDVAVILKDLKEAKNEAAATAKILRASLVVANSLLPTPVKAEPNGVLAD
jgi:hypothetical protein